MSFTLAIVGRPNVGKSTLFNRLVGKRLALVDDRPGVTRDRREGAGRLGDLSFTVVDTAGFDEGAPDSLIGRMMEQTEAAIAGADEIALLSEEFRLQCSGVGEKHSFHGRAAHRDAPVPITTFESVEVAPGNELGCATVDTDQND